MPNFRSHHIVNNLAIIAIAYILLSDKYINIIEFIIFFVGFTIGTDYLSPDLDTKSTPYRRNKVLFFPYKYLSKHRRLNHTFVGTFFMLLYISILVIILALLTSQLELLTNFAYNISIKTYMLFIGGILSANILHIIIDKVF